jgi:hypothetical protein
VNLWLTALIMISVTAIAVGIFLFIRRFAPEGFHRRRPRRRRLQCSPGFAVLLGFVVYLAFSATTPRTAPGRRRPT